VTTLAANKLRTYHYAGDPIREEYPAIAADILFQGSAIGENGSGYSRPLVAGDAFQGFAVAKADNAAGAAGDVKVTVEQKGFVTLPISGLGITANDRPLVYASDDDTFTLTAGSNSLIGTVSRWVSTGIAVVEFDAMWAAGITAALAAAAA
jgi:hypothetical protein